MFRNKFPRALRFQINQAQAQPQPQPQPQTQAQTQAQAQTDTDKQTKMTFMCQAVKWETNMQCLIHTTYLLFYNKSMKNTTYHWSSKSNTELHPY